MHLIYIAILRLLKHQVKWLFFTKNIAFIYVNAYTYATKGDWPPTIYFLFDFLDLLRGVYSV